MSYVVSIRSRHESHDPIRKTLELPFMSVVRFGSTTTLERIFNSEDINNVIECNTVEAVKNSASKRLMKECFSKAGVKTAEWFIYDGTTFRTSDLRTTVDIKNLPYPIISKHIFGSRGTGNRFQRDAEVLESWLEGKTPANYVFERFYDYGGEFRLHVSEDGCFYPIRKLLKRDTPEDERWRRTDENSVWVEESSPSFNKPRNWNEIVEESIKALKAVGLDVGAMDVKVSLQNTSNFIIIETNSAPWFGRITLARYKEELPKILQRKYENK